MKSYIQKKQLRFSLYDVPLHEDCFGIRSRWKKSRDWLKNERSYEWFNLNKYDWLFAKIGWDEINKRAINHLGKLGSRIYLFNTELLLLTKDLKLELFFNLKIRLKGIMHRLMIPTN